MAVFAEHLRVTGIVSLRSIDITSTLVLGQSSLLSGIASMPVVLSEVDVVEHHMWVPRSRSGFQRRRVSSVLAEQPQTRVRRSRDTESASPARVVVVVDDQNAIG